MKSIYQVSATIFRKVALYRFYTIFIMAFSSRSSSSRPSSDRRSSSAAPSRGGYAPRGASQSAPRSSGPSSSYRGGYSSSPSSSRYGSYSSRPARSGGFGGGSSRGGSRGRGRFEQKIDTSRFIFTPTAAQEKTVYQSEHTFADFKFSPILTKNLVDRGYAIPTEIQDKTITHTLAGRDIVGLASTGSGKTAAFLLPLIEKVIKNDKERILILAPTRELAMQINTELRLFTAGLRVFSSVCVGGMPIYHQIQTLRQLNHFVIGTPGRLKDLSKRRSIDFSTFTNVVVDEFDHMLDMGFIDDITLILGGLPKVRQSFFFSATMAPRISAIVQKFLTDPVTINVSTGITTKNVTQNVVRVRHKDDKIEELHKILGHEDTSKTLIFVETKREVESLALELKRAGFRADSIHGDKRQRERQRTLNQFRDDDITVLVATDVAARGIDVKDISHVINYTVPQTYDDYVHRIGRTGRGNSTGKALTFVIER